jgi:cell division protein FtsL
VWWKKLERVTDMAVTFRLPSLLTPRESNDTQQGPALSLVPHTERRFIRVFSVFAVVVIAMGLVVSLRVHMAQQQLRIDRLNYDISRARMHFDSLRAERASLQSPQFLISRAREMGMVPSLGSRIVEVPVSVAADVAANVGKIDADVVGSRETPLDEFGRLKPAVVGAP